MKNNEQQWNVGVRRFQLIQESRYVPFSLSELRVALILTVALVLFTTSAVVHAETPGERLAARMRGDKTYDERLGATTQPFYEAQLPEIPRKDHISSTWNGVHLSYPKVRSRIAFDLSDKSAIIPIVVRWISRTGEANAVSTEKIAKDDPACSEIRRLRDREEHLFDDPGELFLRLNERLIVINKEEVPDSFDFSYAGFQDTYSSGYIRAEENATFRSMMFKVFPLEKATLFADQNRRWNVAYMLGKVIDHVQNGEGKFDGVVEGLVKDCCQAIPEVGEGDIRIRMAAIAGKLKGRSAKQLFELAHAASFQSIDNAKSADEAIEQAMLIFCSNDSYGPAYHWTFDEQEYYATLLRKRNPVLHVYVFDRRLENAIAELWIDMGQQKMDRSLEECLRDFYGLKCPDPQKAKAPD